MTHGESRRHRRALLIVALALVAIVVAFVFIWRGNDVRLVLFVAALCVGAVAGQPGAVLRKTAEALSDGRYVLPICSAMGFAYVVRETGCVAALVRLLLRPLARVPRLLLPGGSAIAFVVNMAIPSQTSTLAAVGPLLVAVKARLAIGAAATGAALVFGASIAGSLVNPGLAEVVAAATLTAIPAPQLAVWLAPAAMVSFAVGLVVLSLVRWRLAARDTPLAEEQPEDKQPQPEHSALKALIPPLPVVWLLLGHPSLPWHAWMRRTMPEGLEVFTAMLAGSALALTLAARDRTKATRKLFEGMGYAFMHIITIIAVSAGTAKALEVAGVLGAFVDLARGNPLIALSAAFVLAFALAVVSGSGTASSVALLTAIGPRAAELGVAPLELAGILLLAAEAGRTTSPVAAVLLFGSHLTSTPAKTLSHRLVIPCFLGAAAGALLCARLA